MKNKFNLDLEIVKISCNSNCSYIRCSNIECGKSSKYIDSDGFLIKDTLAGYIGLQSREYNFYCQDCLPLVINEIKKVFDPKLWIF